MKKKIIALLMASTLAFGICACGDKPASPQPKSNSKTEKENSKTKSVKDIEILEKGYSVSSDYLHFAFTLHNPNSEGYFEYPRVTITAKDSAGKILGTTDQVMGYLGPNDTVSFGSSMNITGSVNTVDFSVSSDLVDTISENNYCSSEELEVSNLSKFAEDEFSTKYTGEIENKSNNDISTAGVTILLKQKGNIVYGETTYISDFKIGNKKPFEFSISNSDVPQYDEFSVSAHYWL